MLRKNFFAPGHILSRVECLPLPVHPLRRFNSRCREQKSLELHFLKKCSQGLALSLIHI